MDTSDWLIFTGQAFDENEHVLPRIVPGFSSTTLIQNVGLEKAKSTVTLNKNLGGV